MSWVCVIVMNQQSDDNSQVVELNEIEDLDDDFVPEGTWPVCPRCFTPCPPLQYYCPHCDSNDAINPLTPYIAFLNIRFNYDIFVTMWRKIWYDRQTFMISRLFYLLMITVFVPIFIVIGLPLLVVTKVPKPKLRKATMVLLCVIAVVLSVLFISFGLARLFPSR
jgi:hypothetical protein